MNNLNIKLAYSDILSFYFSYQSQPPSAFIQVRPEFADLFAKFIPSTDEHGKGFDPNSKGFYKNKRLYFILKFIYLDEKRRRIVLCLKPLKPDIEKTTISSIYHYLKAKSSTMVKIFSFNQKYSFFLLLFS